MHVYLFSYKNQKITQEYNNFYYIMCKEIYTSIIMVHIAHMVPLVHIAGLYHVHQPNHYWGKPERAPHGSVVNVGGTSVTYPTIYATHTAVGWWYERRMSDNLHYIHGVWLVVRPTIYFTNTEASTEATVSWTSSRGVELIASNEDRLRRRRESDRLRRQTETALLPVPS